MTENEKCWQVFIEIDVIVNQLSSQKLLQYYQQIQMQKMKQQAMIQWETTLRIEQTKKIITFRNNLLF